MPCSFGKMSRTEEGNHTRTQWAEDGIMGRSVLINHHIPPILITSIRVFAVSIFKLSKSLV